jgi:hypothetical protein
VRYATINDALRTRFERYGETVLAVALGTLSPVTQGVTDMLDIMNNHREALIDWLTERRDIEERKADRMAAVEVSILVFVVVGVFIDCLLLVKGGK